MSAKGGTYSSKRVSRGLVVGLCVLGLIFFAWMYAPTPTQEVAVGERPISQLDHRIGDLNAPVTLLVYTDLSCPYCKSFDMNTMPRLEKEYGAKILIAYRHHPLSQHKGADKKAEAAECVAINSGEKGFWSFMHAAFSDARAVGHPEDVDALIEDSALVAGSDVPSVKKCLAEGLERARVLADIKDSASAGADVTPSVVVKSAHGRILVHGDRYGQIRTAIEYLLQK